MPTEIKRIKKILTNQHESDNEENQDLSIKANHLFIPENLSWQLDLSTGSFNFIGKTDSFGKFAHLKTINFHFFINLIKKCFIKTHIDLIENIVKVSLNKISSEQSRISFQALLPIKLSTEYYYVKQTIIPLYYKERLIALRFINIPIKKHSGEAYNIEGLLNYEYSEEISTLLKQQMPMPHILTKSQEKASKLIRKGLNAAEIAQLQEKTKAGVYKLNRKILETLTDFFEIEFENVQHAVNYYYQCFDFNDFNK